MHWRGGREQEVWRLEPRLVRGICHRQVLAGCFVQAHPRHRGPRQDLLGHRECEDVCGPERELTPNVFRKFSRVTLDRMEPNFKGIVPAQCREDTNPRLG